MAARLAHPEALRAPRGVQIGSTHTTAHGSGTVRASAAILGRPGTLSDRPITQQSLPGPVMAANVRKVSVSRRAESVKSLATQSQFR